MAGLVLAIALLIIVLSVMNGFDKEMRERILGLVPHVTVYSHVPIEAWEEKAALLNEHPDVLSVTPFSHFDALLMHAGNIDTTRVIGMEIPVTGGGNDLSEHLEKAQLAGFSTDPKGLILGVSIAENLGVELGDTLTLLVPDMQQTQISRGAQYETVVLRATLSTGTELDQSAAVVHLALASRVAQLGDGVSGLQVTTNNIFDVSRIGWELVNNLPVGFYATNWLMTHGNLYAAIQLSRDLISILLFSIIAVAAFNVVSSLVLVVFDKRADIAILRTLGTRPGQIAAIFIVQGAMIGCVGVILGSVMGLLGSYFVTDVVAGLERLLDMSFLNTDVYPVSFLPVEILPSDIMFVGGVAFTMCVLAAIYPALRAARLAPATILNQE
ncbi:MAG: lipoprotein-releasing system permease protein [Bacteroidia bacterium]|jgi:lipoprotein-releasing system permease protein